MPSSLRTTVAPGTMLSVASVTVPAIVPVMLICATRRCGDQRERAHEHAYTHLFHCCDSLVPVNDLSGSGIASIPASSMLVRARTTVQPACDIVSSANELITADADPRSHRPRSPTWRSSLAVGSGGRPCAIVALTRSCPPGAICPAGPSASRSLGTYVSSISFLALPGKAFAANWNPFVFSLSLPLATWIAVRWFVPFYRRGGRDSAYEHLEARFGAWARTYAAACYLLTQIARMGTVIYLLALPMHSLPAGTSAGIILAHRRHHHRLHLRRRHRRRRCGPMSCRRRPDRRRGDVRRCCS